MGKRLATASGRPDGEGVGGPESGKELLTLRGHSGIVSAVGLQPPMASISPARQFGTGLFRSTHSTYANYSTWLAAVLRGAVSLRRSANATFSPRTCPPLP